MRPSFLTASKIHLVCAGLMGLAGVALLASAAHMNGAANIQTAGQFLLFHAPVIMGVTVIRKLELMPMRWAAAFVSVLIFGVVIFAADLSLRSYHGIGLFPNAAPIGGSLTLLSWFGITVCALMRRG